MSMTIEERLAAIGLTVADEDLPKLVQAIGDMDRLAPLVQGARPYAEEPLCAFRLQRG